MLVYEGWQKCLRLPYGVEEHQSKLACSCTCFLEDYTNIHVCQPVCYDIIDHQSDKPNTFPLKWAKVQCCAVFQYFREKKGLNPTAIHKAQLTLTGRMLCLRPWSKSDSQNLLQKDSIQGNPHPGRPETAANQEKIARESPWPSYGWQMPD